MSNFSKIKIVLNIKIMPKFHENFIKSYDEDSDRGYILEVDAEYPKGFTTLQ